MAIVARNTDINATFRKTTGPNITSGKLGSGGNNASRRDNFSPTTHHLPSPVSGVVVILLSPTVTMDIRKQLAVGWKSGRLGS